MSETYLFDVFLSYSPRDKAIVRPLAERLKQGGLRVCFEPDEPNPANIESGLEQSRALVLCLSAHAFGSDWAALESQTFRFRDPLNRDRRFIPLRLDDAPHPGSLAQFLSMDWRPAAQAESFARLLEACHPAGQKSAAEREEARRRFEEKVYSLGHTGWVSSVAFSPDGRYALSGSWDNTVRLWEVESGRAVRVLEGHTDSVWSVAFSPDGERALSGSADNTVRLWEVESGRAVRVLEGHTASVLSVAFSPDGRYAFSAAVNGVWRVWRLEGAAALEGEEEEEGDVQYTNAKVLMVGDTGVGKSGLAERLVHGKFVPTRSTHARQAHILESEVVTPAGGFSLHRETILWDLAGQPAYRSVNQLSMDDAAVACVLFDARSETNPFEGAAYWSQALDLTRSSARIRKLLVASRIDVGGLPSSSERIKAFADDNGFARFIPTSASTGEGCEELLEAIRQEIPWDEMPKVTTSKVLAAVRDYVARLKGEKQGSDNNGTGGRRLFTVASLHEGFASDFGKKIPLAEFIAHLQRLEAKDAVTLLVFTSTGAEPRGEDQVLLDPTRIDAYSSAIMVAAKDEPDGPGHLLESRIREVQFKLDPEERIPSPMAERHVLWYVIEKLLSRDLALRESIKGHDYLVFPSQCTAELRFPGTAAFGVALTFGGRVRSIYARLIAHLAHYEGFKKREFFQDAATYRPEAGGVCVVRLRDLRRGAGELEVLYEHETPPAVRQGFLEFVGKQLEAHSIPGSVTRRFAYHCADRKCGNPFEDHVVKARLRDKKKNLICPICETKTPLVDLLAAPSAAAESVAEQIVMDAQSGRQRMTAAFVIKAKEAEGKFDVFLSHNSKDKAVVEKIAKKLKAVGLRAWLDKWHLTGGDTVMEALEKAIKTVPCGALFFGPADTGNWHIMEIRAYVEQWAKDKARMIPVILPGVKDEPDLPIFLRQTIWVDMRLWEDEQDGGFYRLVCAITGRPPGDEPMRRFSARDVVEWQKKKS